MRPVHILAIATCFCFLATVYVAFINYANSLELIYVHALAGRLPDIDVTGSALQRVAFSQPDLLPVYGSSESILQDNEIQPGHFFRDYPTGFAPFEVSHLGVTFIMHAESIAAVGGDVRGKKVVFSFTPGQFSGPPG